MSAPPARRVVILRDTGAAVPLWFLRCAAPCQSQGWCMEGGVCWLGSSMSEDGARRLAERLGYEVVGCGRSDAP